MHKIYSSKEMIRIIGGVIDTSKANGFSVTPAGPATTNNLLTWEMMKPNDEKC
ncbi:hypothetical protein RB653_008818 [Dictyostelium firmibasis]|uniref:Uncharacterized protein n=1 Tax=Dictyostelium firmibasis TaxID=79012 RepID=A0AAN7YPL0_9MYCE